MSDPKTTDPVGSSGFVRSATIGEDAGFTLVLRDPANATTEDGEAAAWTDLVTFDGRLTEAERRIDRVLARLGVD